MKETLYKENILDHYKNPRNFKKLSSFTKSASLSNISCGDEMEVFVDLDGDLIKDISFQARGCAISIAAMSMLTQEVKDKDISYSKNLEDDHIFNMLGMQKDSARVKCALLGLQTLKKALSS